MRYRMIELRDKQVVSVKDGCVIGYVTDVEVDTECGKLTSIIVTGKEKNGLFFGRAEDYVVPWDCIEVIGNDSVLVTFDFPKTFERKRKNIFHSFFYNN